jgi:hypothetical protein
VSDVTIDLKDLKLLVDYCFQQDVGRRAETAVLSAEAQNNPAGAIAFSVRVKNAEPEAKEMTALRYGDLRAALNSGIGVPGALKAFLKGVRTPRTASKA